MLLETDASRGTISACTRKFSGSLRRRAANYQRIKTRVRRLSGLGVQYLCGHLSSANMLPGPAVVA
jgi:hypothetical protein